MLAESSIGKVAAFAKRKDNVWYLSVLNGVEPESIDLSLDFLGRGTYKMEVIIDHPEDAKKIVIKESTVTSKYIIKQEMISGGGIVARLTLN